MNVLYTTYCVPMYNIGGHTTTTTVTTAITTAIAIIIYIIFTAKRTVGNHQLLDLSIWPKRHVELICATSELLV